MIYKHKITRIQARLAEDGKYYLDNCSLGIPKQYIEDSKVWLKEEVLFKTQEGDDIFEGNTYWCVNTTPHLWSMWEQTSKERTILNKNVLAFSSEISAKNYIKENKPQYSLNDIRNVLNKQMECTHWIMIDVDKVVKNLENEV
jgi:hypothetical protein